MNTVTLTDGSAEIVRGALGSGLELFAGYPITPASRIYEAMIDAGIGLGCPDEITVLQTLMGAAIAGRKVMTATSAPGYSLMVESLGAAVMMELPLTVVLVQRMGPASGSATASAQGDLLLPLSTSGGYRIPTLCPARVEDCARLTATAINLAEALRSPVVLLTEREMVAAQRTLEGADPDDPLLRLPPPQTRERYAGGAPGFKPYGNLNALQVPPFLEAGAGSAQTRYTASTHGAAGGILKASPEAIANTTRLQAKIDANAGLFPPPRLDLQDGAETLVVSYGSTDYAAREAVADLRARGVRVSHATALTLFPAPADALRRAAKGVRRVVIPEENLFGLYRQTLCGERIFDGQEVVGVNQIGALIGPEQICAEVAP
jgi:2-oxoglutarate ferredoxin oxidoreductase subunit alpha